MLIKICGLRTVEHALAAARAGADLIGLVFAPSRRRVSPAEAAVIVDALRAAPAPQPQIVGLFVNSAPAEMNMIAEQIGLDLVQLSGNEPVAVTGAINRPLIKSIRFDGSEGEAEWMKAAAQGATGDRAAPLLLVDAHMPGAYGGTGIRADWGAAARLAAQIPLILAGGLTPDNVAEAVALVRPAGVDVSSGVEYQGVKDILKIEAFIAAARSAS